MERQLNEHDADFHTTRVDKCIVLATAIGICDFLDSIIELITLSISCRPRARPSVCDHREQKIEPKSEKIENSLKLIFEN